jgi:predicted transcriptional regulator
MFSSVIRRPTMSFTGRTGKGATDYLSSLGNGGKIDRRESGKPLNPGVLVNEGSYGPNRNVQDDVLRHLGKAGSTEVGKLAGVVNLEPAELLETVRPLLEKGFVESVEKSGDSWLAMTRFGERVLRYGKIAKV